VEKRLIIGDEVYLVSSLRKDPPDLRLLAKAFLETAITISEGEKLGQLAINDLATGTKVS
jgi:hypothetical protein